MAGRSAPSGALEATSRDGQNCQALPLVVLMLAGEQHLGCSHQCDDEPICQGADIESAPQVFRFNPCFSMMS